MLRHGIKEKRRLGPDRDKGSESPACHFRRLNLTSHQITYGFLYEAGKLGTHFLFLKKEIRKEKFWFKCLDCIIDGLTDGERKILSLKIISK